MIISCPLFAASINPYHSPSEIKLVLIAFPPWTSEESYAILGYACSASIEDEWLDVAHYPLKRRNIIIPMMGLNGRTIMVSWNCRYTRIIGLYQGDFGTMQARRVILGNYIRRYSNQITYFPRPLPTYQCVDVVLRFLRRPDMSDYYCSEMATDSSAIFNDYIEGTLPEDPFGMCGEEGEYRDLQGFLKYSASKDV